jgi:ketosteroid isomerase-like protein
MLAAELAHRRGRALAMRCDRLVRLQDGRITDEMDLRIEDVDVAALLAGRTADL